MAGRRGAGEAVLKQMQDRPISSEFTQRQSPRLYRPDSRFEFSWHAAFLSLIREIRVFRSHIVTIFSSDFRAGYRGTALGVFWNLALPLIPITVYILLVNLRVFPKLEGIAPAVYISFNVTLWYLFAGFINQPIQIVKSRNAEVMKTSMPLSAAIASSFAQLSFDTLIRFALVLVLVGTSATSIKLSAIAFAPIVVVACMFCLGAGLILAVANVIYPDIERVVGIALQYGIFLSGVIFPVSTMGPLAALETANPFNVFIRSARDAVFTGSLSHPGAVAAWSAIGVFLLLFAARFFYVMEYRLRGLV